MAHNEKRTLTDKLSGELSRVYGIHQRVLAGVLRPFAQFKATAKDINDAKFKTKEIVRRLNVQAVAWSRTTIAEAYRSKRIEVAPLAKQAAVFSTGNKEDRSATSIRRLIEKAATGLIEANASIEKTCNKFLSVYDQAVSGVQTAKVNIQAMAPGMEAEMSRKVDYYLARGYDEGSISRKLRDYLKRLVDGKDFIEINGRFYELMAYAEKIARSELHDAYVNATIDEAKKYDCDLLQMSRHDSPCEICAALEGMVFSISGEDEEFPSINDTVTVETAKGPVEVDPKQPHFNCEHNLNPVTRNILEAAGEL